MRIGSVKEQKNFEQRVGIMPSHVIEYLKHGHEVFVEAGLGEGSGFSDDEYRKQGAIVLETASAVWEQCEMIIKVKEPIAAEYSLMQPNQILFTYLHLADNLELTQALLERNVTAVAYETVTDEKGRLPLLKPMSEVAGRLSIQEGAKYLEKTFGGKGILLSGVPGVRGGHVVIIGGGVVGMSACKTALGTGATVSVLDRNLDRLAYIEDVFGTAVNTIYSDTKNIEDELRRADVVIGSVLLPGARAPKLVTRKHLKIMEPGTVLVDVAIDQGGCFESSHPTTHSEPVFVEEGIVHYCVTNMPGAVPQTSTYALGNATLPYGLKIADEGIHNAVMNDDGIKNGLNIFRGYVVNEAVANALEIEFTEYENCVKMVQL
ncbi:alanine dehydrogenase [Erysipelothrix tonsillarum]|uniref:alanine dehydrogenase n=1 Tax=Erysipelothrix tonsillarum TaxID=38402 RepID=UPI000376FC5A|nr:alanine dehydrogenase [Erysipelothrix tonsillarum]